MHIVKIGFRTPPKQRICGHTVEPYAKRVCGVLKKDLRERRKFAAQTCFLHRSDIIERLCAAKAAVYP